MVPLTTNRPSLCACSVQLPGQEHIFYEWCKEGLDGVEVDRKCSEDVVDVVNAQCKGKRSCAVFVGDP